MLALGMGNPDSVGPRGGLAERSAWGKSHRAVSSVDGDGGLKMGTHGTVACECAWQPFSPLTLAIVQLQDFKGHNVSPHSLSLGT
jgi:hypothetical protein